MVKKALRNSLNKYARITGQTKQAGLVGLQN